MNLCGGGNKNIVRGIFPGGGMSKYLAIGEGLPPIPQVVKTLSLVGDLSPLTDENPMKIPGRKLLSNFIKGVRGHKQELGG